MTKPGPARCAMWKYQTIRTTSGEEKNQQNPYTFGESDYKNNNNNNNNNNKATPTRNQA